MTVSKKLQRFACGRFYDHDPHIGMLGDSLPAPIVVVCKRCKAILFGADNVPESAKESA